jgi:carbon storage regulator
MLVLTRKLNETIIIDDSIRITVVGIRGQHVRLGIEAPESIAIFREEICRRPGTGEGRELTAPAGRSTDTVTR